MQKQVAAGEGLLHIGDAARLLAVSVSTLYGWVWQRRIPFIKMGRSVRFDSSDLKAFVEANRQPARRETKSQTARMQAW
jgi:excisionase family DNA binding protein